MLQQNSHKIDEQLNSVYYQFPRYLGLNSSKKLRTTLELEFGFSRRLKKSLKLDQEALNLLKFCFKPKTLNQIVNKFKMTPVQIQKSIDFLHQEGLLTNQIEKQIPEEFKRYDRHLLYYQTLKQTALLFKKGFLNPK